MSVQALVESSELAGPQIWWVPLRFDADPGQVRTEQLHAALTHWFDVSEEYIGAHHWTTKPYVLAPISRRFGEFGVEISLFAGITLAQLLSRAVPGVELRFGHVHARVSGAPKLLRTESWAALRAAEPAYSWEVHFLSPTTFSLNGRRMSPWPTAELVLAGLTRHWNMFAGSSLELSREEMSEVWISGHDLDPSHRFKLWVYPKGRPKREVTVSGMTGMIEFRCNEPTVAAKVDPLFRLAPFTGVGAQREKGLGQVELGRVRVRAKRLTS